MVNTTYWFGFFTFDSEHLTWELRHLNATGDLTGWEIQYSELSKAASAPTFDTTALGIAYVLTAVDKAAARFLSFKRLLRARGLGLVSLASHRQTVDADTPRRWANSACDSFPRSRRISSPVIIDTSPKHASDR